MDDNDLEQVVSTMTAQLLGRSIPQAEVEEFQGRIRTLEARQFENLPTKIQVAVSVSNGVAGQSHVWLRFHWEGYDPDLDDHTAQLAKLFRLCGGMICRPGLTYIVPHLEGAYLKGLEFSTLDELIEKEAADEHYDFCGSFSIN